MPIRGRALPHARLSFRPLRFCYNRPMTRRIAILGGTFDPIHLGHLAVAEDVRFALAAARVLFVPAAQQPFKTSTRTAGAEHRVAMARLATTDNPGFDVSEVEVRRGGISYTVQTVAELGAHYPDDELFFIIGADAAADLHRWFDVERLLALCRIVIVERPGYPLDREALDTTLPFARDRLLHIAGPELRISASELRERLEQGYPVRYHVTPAVAQYIEQHRLYREPNAV